METVLISLIIVLIWGIVPVLQKKLLLDLSYETVLVISGILYFSWLIVYSLVNKDKIKSDVINSHHMKLFVAIMILNIIATISYFYILDKNHSSYIITITSFYPLVTILFANLLLNETIRPELIVLSLVIVLGIIIFKEKQIN
jgi:drug/metabolite transporter (DMT)-like permease